MLNIKKKNGSVRAYIPKYLAKKEGKSTKNPPDHIWQG